LREVRATDEIDDARGLLEHEKLTHCGVTCSTAQPNVQIRAIDDHPDEFTIRFTGPAFEAGARPNGQHNIVVPELIVIECGCTEAWRVSTVRFSGTRLRW
jgi:hypothetical protein